MTNSLPRLEQTKMAGFKLKIGLNINASGEMAINVKKLRLVGI